MEDEFEVKKIDEHKAVVIVPSETLAYLIEDSPLGATIIKKLPKKTITELLSEASKKEAKRLSEFLETIKKKK